MGRGGWELALLLTHQGWVGSPQPPPDPAVPGAPRGPGRKDTQVLAPDAVLRTQRPHSGPQSSKDIEKKPMKYLQGLWAQEGGPAQDKRPPGSRVLADTATRQPLPPCPGWSGLCSALRGSHGLHAHSPC